MWRTEFDSKFQYFKLSHAEFGVVIAVYSCNAEKNHKMLNKWALIELNFWRKIEWFIRPYFPHFTTDHFPKIHFVCQIYVMFYKFCVCKQLLALTKWTTLQEMNISRHTVINGKIEEGKTVKCVKEDKSSRMSRNVLSSLSTNVKWLATQWLMQEPQNSKRSQSSAKTAWHD
jgi:hypothetical protein